MNTCTCIYVHVCGCNELRRHAHVHECVHVCVCVCVRMCLLICLGKREVQLCPIHTPLKGSITEYVLNQGTGYSTPTTHTHTHTQVNYILDIPNCTYKKLQFT